MTLKINPEEHVKIPTVVYDGIIVSMTATIARLSELCDDQAATIEMLTENTQAHVSYINILEQSLRQYKRRIRKLKRKLARVRVKNSDIINLSADDSGVRFGI